MLENASHLPLVGHFEEDCRSGLLIVCVGMRGDSMPRAAITLSASRDLKGGERVEGREKETGQWSRCFKTP